MKLTEKQKEKVFAELRVDPETKFLNGGTQEVIVALIDRVLTDSSVHWFCKTHSRGGFDGTCPECANTKLPELLDIPRGRWLQDSIDIAEHLNGVIRYLKTHNL